MLSNWKSNLLTYCARPDFQCLLPLTEAHYMDVQCNTWLFKINPVNGLALCVCLFIL